MTNEFLKRHEIVKSHETIFETLRSGKRLYGKIVSLYYVPSETMAFAVLIKRSVGKPYQRIRVKRWIREIYRRSKEHIPGTFTLIILANKPYRITRFKELELEIRSLAAEISS